MRAEPGWDVQVLDQIYSCPRPKRTCLTTYPEGYERNEKDGKITYKILLRKGWRYVRFTHFNEQGIPQFESVTTFKKPPTYAPFTPFWGACFSFVHSDAIKLAPFSPETPYLFFGEEIFMAIRYLSFGFDLRAPPYSTFYHLWKR
jgi:hypothetical protein